MWFSTARCVMTNEAAMAALFRPCAISASTSSSRGLSPTRLPSTGRLLLRTSAADDNDHLRGREGHWGARRVGRAEFVGARPQGDGESPVRGSGGAGDRGARVPLGDGEPCHDGSVRARTPVTRRGAAAVHHRNTSDARGDRVGAGVLAVLPAGDKDARGERYHADERDLATFGSHGQLDAPAAPRVASRGRGRDHLIGDQLNRTLCGSA